MKSYVVILLAWVALHATPAIGQFQQSDSWVSDYLGRGGDIRNITGLANQTPSPAKFKSVRVARDLPSKWDWRDVYGVQPIRNQGNCGSCWSFALVAAIESIRIISGASHNAYDLAEQTMVSSCCRSCGSCQGGYFDALNYVKDYGIPWERDDTYRARNTSCKEGYKPATKIHDWFYIGRSGREPTIDELKTAILVYGPIPVGVNGGFGRYGSGVYNACGSRGINHMVNLEGWDDETESWLMRNSWGESWGDNGYMWIKWHDSRGRKCNGIGSVAAAVEVFPGMPQMPLARRWTSIKYE